jgi:hypothetical protein
LLLTVAAKGDYLDAPTARPLSIEWYGIEGKVKAIELNGKRISGWTQQAGAVIVSTPALPVNDKAELKLVLDL